MAADGWQHGCRGGVAGTWLVLAGRTLGCVTPRLKRVRLVLVIGHLFASASALFYSWELITDGDLKLRTHVQAWSALVGQLVLLAAFWILSTALAPSAITSGVRRAFSLFALASAAFTVSAALSAWRLYQQDFASEVLTKVRIATYLGVVAYAAITFAYWQWARSGESFDVEPTSP